ncbi:phage terminase small subunit P27 family [Pseudomonas monteilii]|nr:phage terminase small subunit P27 family [Pseudomonas monteilii]
MKGRTPAPSAQKKVTGTSRPARENKREPQLAVASYQPPPSHMTAEGQAVWKVFCPLASSMGVLAEADLQTLERLCEVAAEVRRLTLVISQEGHTYTTEAGLIKAHPAVAMAADADRRLLSYLTHFGMTPAARSKVQAIGEPPSKDPEDEFFN